MDEGEEEVKVRIPRKRLSRIQLSRIIVEDDEHLVKKIQETIAEEEEERRRSLKLLIPHLKSMRESKGDAAMAKRAKWIKEMEDEKKAREAMAAKMNPRPPPLYSNDFEEVDVSNASFVVVDALQFSSVEFSVLLDFSIKCRYKCCNQLFDHPGYPRQLYSVEKLEDKCEIVKVAIHQYNNVCENAKLKLEKIVKINVFCRCACCDHSEYYMTFSAMNEMTKEVRLYQAAAVEYFDGNYMLGLLKDCSNDRIVAVLSLTGVEEEYLAIQKKKLEDHFRCVVKYGP